MEQVADVGRTVERDVARVVDLKVVEGGRNRTANGLCAAGVEGNGAAAR